MFSEMAQHHVTEQQRKPGRTQPATPAKWYCCYSSSCISFANGSTKVSSNQCPSYIVTRRLVSTWSLKASTYRTRFILESWVAGVCLSQSQLSQQTHQGRPAFTLSLTPTDRLEISHAGFFGLWDEAGEHANSTSKDSRPGVEPETFSLWGGHHAARYRSNVSRYRKG